MAEVKVSDYDRRKPNGGSTHVKSYWRHREGSPSNSPGETNFENEEQEEKEEVEDKYDVEATVTGESDSKGNLTNARVTEIKMKSREEE